MKFLTIITLLLLSCSKTISLRTPANETDHSSYMKDLINLHDFVLKDDSKLFCSQGKLTEAYEKLYGLTQNDIQLEKIKPEDKSKAINLSFNIRIDSRKHLKFINENPDFSDCYSKYRDFTRALRYLEDFLIESVEKEKLGINTYKTLTGFGTYFLVHPDYKTSFTHYNDLKSGDVVLSRGKAYTSAAISRIAADDAQFSHMSFVFKNKTGQLFTTESHIEVGNVTADIKAHIDQKNARTVVFRYVDPEAAKLASQCMFNRVKKRQDQGRIIEYDFGMVYNKADRLFCSEVAYTGFQCLKDKIDIPYTKSRFSKTLLPFLKSIGVAVNERNIGNFKVLSPGDYEFDHRFELVAEWRNPNELKKIRMKDAILTKMFEWMENEQFTIHTKITDKAKFWMAWKIRRSKFKRLKSYMKLEEKMPLNMSTKQMGTFGTLEKIGEMMYQHLEKVSKEKQRLLSFAESLEILEEAREIEERKPLSAQTWYKYFNAKK